jgi:hypothetical protein
MAGRSRRSPSMYPRRTSSMTSPSRCRRSSWMIASCSSDRSRSPPPRSASRRACGASRASACGSSRPPCGSVGFPRRRRLQRALEVVDDRQEAGQHVGADVVGELAALALHALAVVVELGGRAQQPFLQRVALPARGLEAVGSPAVPGALRSSAAASGACSVPPIGSFRVSSVIRSSRPRGRQLASRSTRDTACVVPSTSEMALE